MAGRAADDNQGTEHNVRTMKQSGKTTLFVLVCAAAILGAYGVGLGVKNMRLAGTAEQASAAAETEKSADKPESDEGEVVADTDVSPEPAAEWAEELYEEPKEEFAAQPERSGGGGAQMVAVGSRERGAMRERFQNMHGEEAARRELQAKRARIDEENYSRVQEAWPNLDENTRGKIRGIIERWPTLSEEERDYYRAGNIE